MTQRPPIGSRVIINYPNMESRHDESKRLQGLEGEVVGHVGSLAIDVRLSERGWPLTLFADQYILVEEKPKRKKAS